jgi:predicted transglutaminase-like cysteine proteinase
MFGSIFKWVIEISAIFTLGLGLAQAGEANWAKTSYAAVGKQTLVPYGWVDFCNRYEDECDDTSLSAMDVNLTPATQKILVRVNGWVNSHVKPLSDMQHWGVVDRWDYPTDGSGDCEDYVLYKRRLLMAEGFPRQALLVTVVKDEHGDGHAVLTVKTNQGEYILDNLREPIRAWEQTNYKFVKRQSQENPNIWVDIGGPAMPALVVSR